MLNPLAVNANNVGLTAAASLQIPFFDRGPDLN